jgi:hypothetical protein
MLAGPQYWFTFYKLITEQSLHICRRYITIISLTHSSVTLKHFPTHKLVRPHCYYYWPFGIRKNEVRVAFVPMYVNIGQFIIGNFIKLLFFFVREERRLERTLFACPSPRHLYVFSISVCHNEMKIFCYYFGSSGKENVRTYVWR